MADFTQYKEYLYTQVRIRSIYVLGGQGQLVVDILPAIPSMESVQRTKEILERIKKNFYEDSKYDIFVAKAFDCSGLGTYYFLKVGLIKYDMTADDLYKLCKKISKKELKPGDFVFQEGEKTITVKDETTGKEVKKIVKYMHHIGYFVGDNKVIEAKGRLYGVVESEYSDSRWSHAGRPPFWDEDIKPVLTRELYYTNPMMRGDDVEILQETLNNKGYNCGDADGIFGKKTDIAVRNFQSDKGLTVDGIVGRKTAEALGFEFKPY